MRATSTAAGLCLALYFCGSAGAQTNTVTNLVRAADNFRKVDGQLYNVLFSQRFEKFRGTVVAVLSNGIVINKQVEKSYKVPAGARRSSDSLVSSGNFLGGSPSARYVPTQRTEHRWENSGEMMFVKNFPKDNQPTTGSEQSGHAMSSGTMEWEGGVIKVFDYGLPNIVEVITTNSPAVKTNKSK